LSLLCEFWNIKINSDILSNSVLAFFKLEILKIILYSKTNLADQQIDIIMNISYLKWYNATPIISLAHHSKYRCEGCDRFFIGGLIFNQYHNFSTHVFEYYCRIAIVFSLMNMLSINWILKYFSYLLWDFYIFINFCLYSSISECNFLKSVPLFLALMPEFFPFLSIYYLN
jgi:hypothetical protein